MSENIHLIKKIFKEGFATKEELLFPHFGKTKRSLENNGFVFVGAESGLGTKSEKQNSENAQYYFLQKEEFYNIEIIVFLDETIIINYEQ